MNNTFGENKNYILYRTVYDLLHPTISRKNITNYKIVLQDDLVPIRVFYPSKETRLEKIVIYIHGEDSDYEQLCKDLALNTDSLVLAVDYQDNPLEECLAVITYLLKNNKEIEKDKISLIGDGLGADLILTLTLEHKVKIKKQVLFYPLLKEIKEPDTKIVPDTLFFTAELDPNIKSQILYFDELKKRNNESLYFNIENAPYGFFNNSLNFKRENCFEIIKKFIN